MDQNNFEQNFSLLSHSPEQPVPIKEKGRLGWYIAGGVGLIILLLVVLAGIEALTLASALKISQQAKKAVEQSLEQAGSFNFSEAHINLQSGKDSMNKAQKQVEGIRVLRILPWVGTQVRGADGVLTASAYALEGIDRSFVWASDIPFQSQGETVASVDPEKSKKAFSRLLEFPSLVIMVDNLFVQALNTLNEIPQKGGVSDIVSSQQTLQTQIATVEKILSQYVPLAQTLPHVSGATEDKTYLWILMNNDELRPTGGYISGYAYMHFSGGALKEFFVDNSRNLDKGISATSKKAPAPIQQYDAEHNLGSSWLFHVATWSPDYPTAAQDIIALFTEQMEKQNKTLQRIDGVVAITPSFVEKFLALTGPVDIQGYHIDDSNLADVLEIDANRGFRERGLSEEQRKELIFDLGTTLLRTLGKKGVTEWVQVMSAFEQGMKEKQMMVFHADEAVQEKVRQKSWDGRIAQTAGDYLMVADANLGSFKSDIGIDRSIEYSVDLTDNEPKVSVTITYQNKNTLIWKTRPVYRTYTRVYAPQGSRLLEARGIAKQDITSADELQKTSFGMLIDIPIGRKKSISLTYTLAQDIIREPYSLIIQKQPGTKNVPLTARVKTPRPLKITPQAGERLTENNTRYEVNTRLFTDQNYSFSF